MILKEEFEFLKNNYPEVFALLIVSLVNRYLKILAELEIYEGGNND